MEKEMLAEYKAQIKKWCAENKTPFYEAAMRIWEAPELSLAETKSSKVLLELLEKYGFDTEAGVAGMPTAFIASFGCGRPVIGINCEYDALPGLSQEKNVQEKRPRKEGSPGHGCGHNLLGTAGVKAAAAVSLLIKEGKLSGTIRVIGAPAEELCLGKPYLGKAGLLEGYDAFLDWHPWSYNRMDYDSCCAYFSIKYHFKGKACHGNAPWHGRSALDGALLQAQACEMLREHLPPGCPPDAANTFNYTFSDTGPEFPSVVPDAATAWYVGRFVTTGEARDALRRITDCARGAAIATETRVETELICVTHHKIPNRTLAEVMRRNFEEIGVPAFTEEEQETAREIQRAMGVAESGLASSMRPFGGGYTVVCDTSEYSWNAPYASLWVAMGPENTGWHNWGVTRCAADTMGQKSMDTAAEVIASTACELMFFPELTEKAGQEWQERMAGEQYGCLLPEDAVPPVPSQVRRGSTV